MQWFYAQNGQQVGPVEEAALDDLVRQGVVRDDTLVWTAGMPSWQPHGTARGARAMPPPVLPGTPVMAPMPPGAPMPAAPRYGGFWIRFLARVIDVVLVSAIGAIIRIPLAILGIGAIGGLPANPGDFMEVLPLLAGIFGLSLMISIALQATYEVYFVSTRGATPGKMVLGLKIVRADGSPIPVGLAFGRFCAHWLSGLALMIGYIIAGFDKEKRALHDHICGTRVIYAA